MSTVKGFIQQYGAIVESLVHAFLSFAPVAAGTEDSDAEKTIQLIQSISDVVALRRDKFLDSSGNTKSDALRFVLRVIKCFQLWCEMRSSNGHKFALRLELVRVSLSVALLQAGGRLPDTEMFEVAPTSPVEYVGSRTGTRLKSLPLMFGFSCDSDTQLSDFLHAISPLLYLASSGGWDRAKWSAWFLAIFLEYASIIALPQSRNSEKSLRLKKLIVDSLIRQPMFSSVIERPVGGVSRLWNKIPLLCDFNYLEYYLHMHKRYFYFHQ